MRTTTLAAATSGRHRRPRWRQRMNLFDTAKPEAGAVPLSLS
ncbi:hypothetical protein [Bosea sp. BIWAKO-01]|nr:hypothetical protein [Bosea sp. BIWAKO-01]GAU86868.1 hypothetical protein BIWAKO_06816 [Bosea sp. BIWAKO-01]